jgi:Uma2 family endonuclease
MVHATKVRPITVEEYFEHYPETAQPMELINGEVIMSPAPKRTHQFATGRLFALMLNFVLEHDLGTVENSPNDVVFDELNTVQPDVFYVAKDNTRCKITEDDYWEGAPDLCVEVLSPSTAKQDRDKKFKLYETHGVREYWIVSPSVYTIEIYILENGTFKQQGVYDINDTISPVILPDLKIAVSNLFP